MVFTYKGWALYTRESTLKAGNKPSDKKLRIYFFSKRTPKSGEPCEMPEGYEIFVNPKNGFPLLKYNKSKISTWKNPGKRSR